MALQNRCAHRSYPLSKSTLAGDVITCGYHGIEYDAQGRCVGIPCQDIIPKTFAIQSYPLVERAPFVWIWIGDAAAADPVMIPPELDFFADPGWETAIHGYFAIECNYLAMHENLLDLTHFPFLHGDKAGSVAYAKSPFDVAVHGDQVSITRIMRNGLLASQRAKISVSIPRSRSIKRPTRGSSPRRSTSATRSSSRSAVRWRGRQLCGEIVHALTAREPIQHPLFLGERAQFCRRRCTGQRDRSAPLGGDVLGRRRSARDDRITSSARAAPGVS